VLQGHDLHPPATPHPTPREIISEIETVEEALDHLNSRYADALSVADRHDRTMHAQILVEKACEYLDALSRVLVAIDHRRLFPDPSSQGTQRSMLRQSVIDAQGALGRWYQAYDRNRYEPPKDDLAIEARRIAYAVRTDIEPLLRPLQG
jgi:hypothetical protein